MYATRTILFIDEIHRFNKAQQDALLGAVEDGVIVLIGATTENPYFEGKLGPGLPLQDLPPGVALRRRYHAGPARRPGRPGAGPGDSPLSRWTRMPSPTWSTWPGRCTDGLEHPGSGGLPDREKGSNIIALESAEEAAQHKALLYDKWGDNHYDTISAFIKSMRGSDPDAALYWLARMLEAGEDPRFIARRMVIFASEDVGLADSQALLVAEAAARAVEFVGLPEAQLNLAHAAVYLALAPKSNSTTVAFGKAMREVKEGAVATVPIHLRDSSYRGPSSSATARVISIPITTPAITWSRPTSPTTCAARASTNRREVVRRHPWPTPGASAPGRTPRISRH